MNFVPKTAAADPVVPVPIKGSHTVNKRFWLRKVTLQKLLKRPKKYISLINSMNMDIYFLKKTSFSLK